MRYLDGGLGWAAAGTVRDFELSDSGLLCMTQLVLGMCYCSFFTSERSIVYTQNTSIRNQVGIARITSLMILIARLCYTFFPEPIPPIRSIPPLAGVSQARVPSDD